MGYDAEADKDRGGEGDFLGTLFGDGVFSTLSDLSTLAEDSEERRDLIVDETASFSIETSPTTPFTVDSKLSNRFHSFQISGVTPCID